jgi:hypothetical protein
MNLETIRVKFTSAMSTCLQGVSGGTRIVGSGGLVIVALLLDGGACFQW